MATTPAPGVQLYLYRLLKDASGVGRQTLLPKVEEVLAADGIDPADLDCASVRELLGTLDFVALTDFRGGRTYATLAARADFDEALAALADAEAEGAKPKKGGRPWKRKRAALKPVRPQHKVAKKAKAETEPAPEHEPADAQAEDDAADALTDAHMDEVTEPELASVISGAPGPEAEPDAPEIEPPEEEPPVALTLAEILAEARAEEAARAEQAAQAEEAQTAKAETEAEGSSAVAGSATETITQGSVADVAPTPAAQAEPNEAASASLTTRDLPRGLPVAFWDDVRCPDNLLAKLANLLPLDADVHTVVDEDWQVARSTGTLQAGRTHASFALRYRGAGSEPLTVTIERQTGSGKRWVVTSVEGTATTGTPYPAPQEALVDRLPEMPLVAGEAWAELSAAHLPVYRRRNLAHEFASAVAIGGWGDLCSRVAETAAAEPWGPANTHGLPYLHEYLLIHLTRAVAQNRIAKLPDRNAVWNTGLLTPDGRHVCCILGGPRADGARPLVDVCTSADARLAIADLPLPASYIEALEDVCVASGACIEVAPHAHVSYELAQAALARATASWRTAATAWDPQDLRCKLLLPASTKGETIDAALLAEHDAEHPGILVARRLLTLNVAYACSRVVSGDLPAWLTRTAR